MHALDGNHLKIWYVDYGTAVTSRPSITLSDSRFQMHEPIKPIFVHSLYRSGSTYVFEAFRRSAAGYWCYQEPMHEALLKVLGSPEILEEDPAELAATLRHSTLSRPYFWEFKAAQDNLPQLLNKEMMYDRFFSCRDEDLRRLSAYFACLSRKAKGRPVFQDCRLFARTAQLAREFGGAQLYLWRNPRDQWWSNKVHPHFDVTYLLILNAQDPPAFIQALKREIAFVEHHDASLDNEFAFFYGHLPDARRSYLVFYCVWCYALFLNTAADCKINIDLLSTSPTYRASLTRRLEDLGIAGLDFSDCSVPQGIYTDREDAFFAAVETEAHELLRQSGLSEAVSLALQERSAHEPTPSKEGDIRALENYRGQILRGIEQYSGLERRAHELEGVARALQRQLDAIHNSLPWRLSTPFRWLLRKLRGH